MNNRHDYGKNGVLIIDNVREHIERNDFPRIPIGSIAGMDGWFIKIRIGMKRGRRMVSPFLCRHGNKKVPFEMRLFCNFITNDGISVNATQSYCRSFLRFLEHKLSSTKADWLLNHKNGCLNDNGGLTFEYGIHVKSIKEIDGIWRFNVFDNTFENMGDKISFIEDDGEQKFLHYHKQLVEMESGDYKNILDYETLALCLQIAHGVRINGSRFDLGSIAYQAQFKDLPNVVRYCEQKLIEKKYKLKGTKFAIEADLNHYLARLMKNLKFSEELKKILEDVDVEEMSGEAMKQCAMFFFKNLN